MFTSTQVFTVAALSEGRVILIENVPHYVYSVRANIGDLVRGTGPHSIHCMNLKSRELVEWIRDGESQIPVIKF